MKNEESFLAFPELDFGSNRNKVRSSRVEGVRKGSTRIV